MHIQLVAKLKNSAMFIFMEWERSIRQALKKVINRNIIFAFAQMDI